MNEALIAASVFAGILLEGVGVFFVSFADRRLRQRGYLLLAAGSVLLLLSAVVAHNTFAAVLHSVTVAYWVYEWWNGGGGDGMKKAWKSLKGRFTVLRAAPGVA